MATPSSALVRFLGPVLFGGLVLLCVATPAAAQYGGTPTISVDKPVVETGDEITVTIDGCLPEGNEVVITIGGVEVGTLVIGPDGSGSAVFTVPDGLSGEVDVTGSACDGQDVTTVITVVPPDGGDDDGGADDAGDDAGPDDGDGGGGPTDDGDGGADLGSGPDGPLPFTGSATGLVVRIGLGLLGVGALLLFLASRADRGDRPTEAGA